MPEFRGLQLVNDRIYYIGLNQAVQIPGGGGVQDCFHYGPIPWRTDFDDVNPTEPNRSLAVGQPPISGFIDTDGIEILDSFTYGGQTVPPHGGGIVPAGMGGLWEVGGQIRIACGARSRFLYPATTPLPGVVMAFFLDFYPPGGSQWEFVDQTTWQHNDEMEYVHINGNWDRNVVVKPSIIEFEPGTVVGPSPYVVANNIDTTQIREGIWYMRYLG